MKKNSILLVFCVSIAALFIFGSCSTTPPKQQDFADGKYLKGVFTDHYDPSKPIEEQCYVVNLAIGSRFTTFNGEKAKNAFGVVGNIFASVEWNNIMIVPPGKHTFGFIYYRDTSLNSHVETSGSFTHELEAGNYYFLASSVGTDEGSWLFDNLEDYSEVLVYGNSYNSFAMMSVDAIISGINAKISSKFKNFNPPLRGT